MVGLYDLWLVEKRTFRTIEIVPEFLYNVNIDYVDRGGIYTLTIGNDDPSGAGTGAYRIKVWDLPAPDEFTIALGDQIERDEPGQGAGYTENPGSNDMYTFTADSGQDVYFQVLEPLQTNDTINCRAKDDQGNEVFNTCLQCGDRPNIIEHRAFLRLVADILEKLLQQTYPLAIRPSTRYCM